ncbi:MAG: ABC transporter substrate-binding protein [Proteobacteria bacterium]|nr:ABC transporter substrate-binding protein [Pseudomonadota bacterium]
MKRVKALKGLIGLGFVAALAAPLAATAAERVRVGLAAPGYTAYAPVYAAAELGFYKAKGLDVELTVYRGGGAAQQAMVANAADIINYFPPGMALAVKKGVKEKIVAAGGALTPHGWHMLVRKDSSVKSLADLAGKKIGVTSKASTTDYYALWAANSGGGKAMNIPLGGRGLIPALKSGDIDAAVLWPNLTLRLIEGGQYRSLVNYGKAMKPNLPEVWVAAQSFIDSKPQAVKGFLEAIMKATKHMQENRAFALMFIKKFTGEKKDSTVAVAYEAIIKNATTDGMMDDATLKRSLGLAALAGIKDLPPVDQLFTSQFLPINPN